MTLYGPPAAGGGRIHRSDETDPRLNLARNLDHIDEISAQLAEIHELIEPRDELFDSSGTHRETAPTAAEASRTAVPTSGSQRAGVIDDDTTEVPMWQGPEHGRTLRLPVAPDAVIAETAPSRQAVRRGGIRRRLLPVAVAAVVLAIPAMVITSVQPWRDGGVIDGTTGDTADSLRGGQNETSIASSGQPEPTTQPESPEAPTSKTGVGKPGSGTSSRGETAASPKPRDPIPAASPRTGEVAPLAVGAELVGGPAISGSPTTFQVTWRDGSGYFGALSYTATDGTSGSVPDETQSCDGVTPAGGDTRTLSHTFTGTGMQTITFTLSTYTCDGRMETSTATVTANVAAAAPMSSPPVTTPS